MNLDILPQLLINALITGSIYAMVSLGLALIYGQLRILNFSHGQTLMLGAYCYYYLSHDLEIGIWQSLLATLIFALVFTFISYHVFIKPFINSNTIIAFVSTLAFAIILESVVSMVFGVNTKSLSSDLTFDIINYQNTFISKMQIIIIAVSLITLFFVAFLIHKTSLGRWIRAASNHQPACIALGISTNHLYIFVYGLGVVVAMYAGILIGYETNLQPVMGNSYTIKGFAAMILGGIGNVWGTIAGSFALALIENLGIGLEFWGESVPTSYKDAFAFIIILLVLLVRPQGLFNRKGRNV